jgi:pyruvate formate lyase activating enzyme
VGATPVTGRIFDIQRFSVHDGPGIRTTVFLKGCPLRCVWCHNPEGLSAEPQLSFAPEKCIGCGYCFRACPNRVHVLAPDGRHIVEWERCRACGLCTEECFAGALQMVGRDATVGEVMQEVLADRAFYEESGGGMTLSGGEPMMQVEFTEALLRRAGDEGIRRCLDTSGHCEFARFERVLSLVDLFLYDVKETDDARHREFTGVTNRMLLENLRKLHDRGASILVRLPLIPGYNDREGHFRGVARLTAQLPDLVGVELLPYHPLGSGKAERIGLDSAAREESHVPDREAVATWAARLRRLGVPLLGQDDRSPASSRA